MEYQNLNPKVTTTLLKREESPLNVKAIGGLGILQILIGLVSIGLGSACYYYYDQNYWVASVAGGIWIGCIILISGCFASLLGYFTKSKCLLGITLMLALFAITGCTFNAVVSFKAASFYKEKVCFSDWSSTFSSNSEYGYNDFNVYQDYYRKYYEEQYNQNSRNNDQNNRDNEEDVYNREKNGQGNEEDRYNKSDGGKEEGNDENNKDDGDGKFNNVPEDYWPSIFKNFCTVIKYNRILYVTLGVTMIIEFLFALLLIIYTCLAFRCCSSKYTYGEAYHQINDAKRHQYQIQDATSQPASYNTMNKQEGQVPYNQHINGQQPQSPPPYYPNYAHYPNQYMHGYSVHAPYLDSGSKPLLHASQPSAPIFNEQAETTFVNSPQPSSYGMSIGTASPFGVQTNVAMASNEMGGANIGLSSATSSTMGNTNVSTNSTFKGNRGPTVGVSNEFESPFCGQTNVSTTSNGMDSSSLSVASVTPFSSFGMRNDATIPAPMTTGGNFGMSSSASSLFGEKTILGMTTSETGATSMGVSTAGSGSQMGGKPNGLAGATPMGTGGSNVNMTSGTSTPFGGQSSINMKSNGAGTSDNMSRANPGNPFESNLGVVSTNPSPSVGMKNDAKGPATMNNGKADVGMTSSSLSPGGGNTNLGMTSGGMGKTSMGVSTAGSGSSMGGIINGLTMPTPMGTGGTNVNMTSGTSTPFGGKTNIGMKSNGISGTGVTISSGNTTNPFNGATNTAISSSGMDVTNNGVSSTSP
ncbi:nuclear pore complex protein DDB_G0274915-like [Hydractinia symbiolongicarpus]|uniref:nuclear pore complex protein DDB_G0274915-like n=1 Tax=Hydractinia symbiolongicarpus TaxID=13093 RepID=UPI00254E8906|nr:nuclear pore complex protein DDB_G0274915-like [Hydractinia symbiolongicarpus]